MRRYVVTGLLLLVVTAWVAGCTQEQPTPDDMKDAAPDPRMDLILERLDTLAQQLAQVEENIATLSAPPPTPIGLETPGLGTPAHGMPEEPTAAAVSAPTAASDPEGGVDEPSSQEVAIIENYAATRFFPGTIVVVKDVPVTMYLTRLHREHINRFTIEPFFSSSEVILPGEIGVIEFVPDQLGEFKIRNVGHAFEADLVVVGSEEEKGRYISQRGVQMYSLIHSIDDFRIFPERLSVLKGVTARFHNISLVAEHQVAFGPFHDPDGPNVRPGEVNIVEFTPDVPGEHTILHEVHGITGILVVE